MESMRAKTNALSFCSQLDYSRFPKLKKEDVEEKVTKGWGPGGQSVNKTSNAVRLKHLPTGATVKVHESRSLERNREIAWKRLAEEVDAEVNGEGSVREQIKRLEKEHKDREKETRRRKREAKKAEKEGREDGGDTSDTEEGPTEPPGQDREK